MATGHMPAWQAWPQNILALSAPTSAAGSCLAQRALAQGERLITWVLGRAVRTYQSMHGCNTIITFYYPQNCSARGSLPLFPAQSLHTRVLTCTACLATACFWSRLAWPQSVFVPPGHTGSRQLVGTARIGAGRLVTYLLEFADGKWLAKHANSTIFYCPQGSSSQGVSQSYSFC